jgi:hypothetical protein
VREGFVIAVFHFENNFRPFIDRYLKYLDGDVENWTPVQIYLDTETKNRTPVQIYL